MNDGPNSKYSVDAGIILALGGEKHNVVFPLLLQEQVGHELGTAVLQQTVAILREYMVELWVQM